MRESQAEKVLVYLTMGSPAGSKQLAGIYRYASNKTNWDIVLSRQTDSMETLRELYDGSYSGIISSRGANPEVLASIKRSHTCLVLVDSNLSDPTTARGPAIGHVKSDDRRAGYEGARHLLSLGEMRTYGYIPAPGHKSRWSILREEGMRAALAERGLAATTYDYDSSAMEDWIAALPKPAALMAASDDIASKALILCHKLKIAVPGQVVLIGNDNDALICDNCRPRLSSVQIGHEEEGFAAAKMLHAMLRRPNWRAKDILIPPQGVVVRESTRPVSPAASLIDRALVYIRENAADGIGVDDVAHSLNVSRRLLYLRFREQLGRTVLDVIAERRIELLKAKLSASSEQIAALSLSCGFKSANHAKRAFRAATGLTMREWRADAAIQKVRSRAGG